MGTEEQEKDRLIDIQNKMNNMNVAKRKRTLLIFAFICAATIILRIFLTFGGCSKNITVDEHDEKTERIKTEQQQVMEYSLERKKQLDSNVEELLDRMVEEDRKEMEKKNGEAK